MSIIFKPTGSLDVSTDPTSLPEEAQGKALISSAMQRCKNLRLDQNGVLKTRDGSQKLNSDSAVSGAIDFIIEANGYRYTFTSTGLVYRNETIISDGVQCEAPEFSPAAGEYASAQTVTITSDTTDTTIYYTLDGSTPSETNGYEYSAAVVLPLFADLKAIATKNGWVDSDVTSGYYSAADANFITEGQDIIITETDENNLVTEGTS